MKRYLAAALVLTLFTALHTSPAAATGRGPCSSDRYDVTRSMTRDLRVHKMKVLIRCVFTEVGVGGQVSKAFQIVDRESSFWPWAINHAYDRDHDCLGLFQHMRWLWAGRARALPDRYFPNPNEPGALQPRANVWAAARMVLHDGWGAWSTA